MNSQKLGLVLGMNMAVACLVFQGCKVTRPGMDNVPPPTVDPAVASTETTPVATVDQAPSATVSTTSQSVVAPDSASTVSSIDVSTTSDPAIAPQPSQVATVKPLPSAKKRPAAATVSAASPAADSAVATTASAQAAGSVVVQRGDTLSGICVRNRVKMSAVLAANPGLNPNRIRVGQKIAIPGGVAVAAAAPAKSAASKVMQASAPAAANTTAPVKTKNSFKSYSGPTKEYKVRSGDSLGRLAYDNGITIRALKEMNKLTSDRLNIGQTILIPAEKVAAKAAPVVGKPEEKKAVEAKKPVAPVAEKKAAPAAADTTLTAAVEKPAAPAVEAAAPQVAEVSAPAEAAPVAAAAENVPPPAEPAAAPSLTYTVKEGDDIVGVAITWGISPSQLMDLNNLKAGEAITPGQVLKLPANAKQQ